MSTVAVLIASVLSIVLLGPVLGCAECQREVLVPAVYVTVVDADGEDITDEAEITYEQNGAAPQHCGGLWGPCGVTEGHYRIIAVVRSMTLEQEVDVPVGSDCCAVSQEVIFELP